MKKHFALATAGHVDHGKSALVKALTGTDPDRLPEEKARGISIDLGFAQLILPGPDEDEFHVGIVDVPGHEDFIRNMIAGVGSIDLALLVVAADDGWMPQTEEHLQILVYLGVKRALIALTKSDLGNIDKVTTQIREQLRGTAFANSHIIPTSIRTGQGIEDLKRALTSEFATLSPQRDIDKARLFVDRAFTLRGIGTVVTGTLAGGKLRRGQNVIIQPQNVSTRIRSLQSHGLDLEFAEPGMRTALNLPDIEIGTGPAAVRRGDLITIADLLRSPCATVDVLLEKSPRLSPKHPAGRALKNGTSVYVHHGTRRILASASLLEKGALECGDRSIARLRFESPILALLGDRFVLRDASGQHTIAGGIVLDPDSDQKSFRSSEQLQFLKTRVAAPQDVDLCVQSELIRDGFGRRAPLLHKSNFGANEIAAALLRLQNRGAIILRNGIAADADYWKNLRLRAAQLIDSAHEKHPERRGLDLARLRADLDIESDELFASVVSELLQNGFSRTENLIARDLHRPSLPAEISPAAEKICATLAEKPFDPPGRKEFSKDRHLQQALRFLIEGGEIIELNDEVVLLSDSAGQMRRAVSEFISVHGPATASQLRQKIGTSRRVIIPFLEYLDRIGATQRIGDLRQLRETKSAAVARR